MSSNQNKLCPHNMKPCVEDKCMGWNKARFDNDKPDCYITILTNNSRKNRGATQRIVEYIELIDKSLRK